MSWPRMIRMTALLAFSLSGAALYAQTPSEEIAPLPLELAPERADALRSLSPAQVSAQVTAPRRPHRYFFRKLHHPLTPADVALRESVRSLGADKHRFVRCELSDHSVITGAITSIGDERFFVRTGIMGNGQAISYRELSAEPRPVAAVGEHLKNGLEWTGVAGLAVVLAPIFFVLGVTGVIQD